MAGGTLTPINTAQNPAWVAAGGGNGEDLGATQTADFTAENNFFYPVDPAAGNVNATLPAASSAGGVGQSIDVVEIKNIAYADVGTVTVLPAGGDTVEGEASLVIPPGGSVRLVSDGVSNWMAAP